MWYKMETQNSIKTRNWNEIDIEKLECNLDTDLLVAEAMGEIWHHIDRVGDMQWGYQEHNVNEPHYQLISKYSQNSDAFEKCKEYLRINNIYYSTSFTGSKDKPEVRIQRMIWLEYKEEINGGNWGWSSDYWIEISALTEGLAFVKFLILLKKEGVL